MDRNAVVLGTIEFEELPLHLELQQLAEALQPSSIEEHEDDSRSLLYLFDDNDFEQAAAFLAIEEARQRAQVEAVAEALIQAEDERQRTQALASSLRQLFEEDEALVDMLGRRILATKGHQVPDLWHPHHYHHRRHDPYQHQRQSVPQGSSAQGSGAATLPSLARFIDIHAAWEELDDETARASPFIHAAPVIQGGDAFYQPKSRFSNSARPHTHTRIAIHPFTGVPMLLVEQDTEAGEDVLSPADAATEFDVDTDDEADEWSAIDESDIDWLGRELLRLRGGANVWVLGADHDAQPVEPQSASSASTAPSGQSTSTAFSTAKSMPTAAELLPTHIEEADSDHERGGGNSARLSSASHRVAAALAQAALRPPASEEKSSSPKAGQTTRQRAATVMSESEEEELETVGKVVENDASSLDNRPRKSVKVVDMRS